MQDNVKVYNPTGRHPVVLVCEHASGYFPPEFDYLGLSEADRVSHIAWDPGALETARRLADRLDAVLVEGVVSRSLGSDGRAVPGNVDLSDADRQQRIDAYYTPFQNTLDTVLKNHPCTPLLITIHSFTPVFEGKPRAVEVGILHDTDTRLADQLLACASGYCIERNEPYGPQHGVTHTLQAHGVDKGLHNVMVEVASNLISTDAQCDAMAADLATWITAALERLSADGES